MKAHLAFVPPGGGETDFWWETDLPGAPSVGDYIEIQPPPNTEPDASGMRSYIVRRVRWGFSQPVPTAPLFDILLVECEFARGVQDCPEHKRSCEMYEKRGKPVKELDVSAY